MSKQMERRAKALACETRCSLHTEAAAPGRATETIFASCGDVLAVVACHRNANDAGDDGRMDGTMLLLPPRLCLFELNAVREDYLP
jgi:hypothetical protein